MADESNFISTNRLVLWSLIAFLILVAIALYFRDGLHLPRFGSAPAASVSAAATSQSTP
jgi:hypothetical protein